MQSLISFGDHYDCITIVILYISLIYRPADGDLLFNIEKNYPTPPCHRLISSFSSHG
jgi:hypothetical protein